MTHPVTVIVRGFGYNFVARAGNSYEAKVGRSVHCPVTAAKRAAAKYFGAKECEIFLTPEEAPIRQRKSTVIRYQAQASERIVAS